MPEFKSPVETSLLDSVDDIRVILDSRQRKALLPFVGREVSISQAAKESAESPNTMLKRVQRWLAMGLLIETGRVVLPKGIMSLYRTKADAFFIPHRATPAEDLLALTQQIYLPMMAGFLQAYVQSGQHLSGDWGVRFERLDGRWWVRPVKDMDDRCEPTDEGLPASLLDINTLCLEDQEAKALQRELRAVVEKYKQCPASKGKTYQVVLGIA